LAGAESNAVCTLMPMVLASFLRLVASPKIFKSPTTLEGAIGFVDALLSVPRVQLAELGPEWKRLRALCLDKELSDNEVPDAWLAAAVAQRGEHLVSFDRLQEAAWARSVHATCRSVLGPKHTPQHGLPLSSDRAFSASRRLSEKLRLRLAAAQLRVAYAWKRPGADAAE
jgi:predicted nucleic acid-binding protein